MQGKAKNQSNFYQYKNERITREKKKIKTRAKKKKRKSRESRKINRILTNTRT